MKNVCINNWLKNFLGRPAGGKFCGALKSFCRMQNLTQASTSLDSAHQEQLILTYSNVHGAATTARRLIKLICVVVQIRRAPSVAPPPPRRQRDTLAELLKCAQRRRIV